MRLGSPRPWTVEPDAGLHDPPGRGAGSEGLTGWNAVRLEQPRQAMEHRNRLEQARNKGNVPAIPLLRLALEREREIGTE